MNVNHFHTTVVRNDGDMLLVKSNPTGMHYLIYQADSTHNYSAFNALPSGDRYGDTTPVARALDIHDVLDAIYALR